MLTQKTVRNSSTQPYRQPPTMLAYVVVPVVIMAALVFFGWLIF
jgi:hypothetical protein